MKKPIRLTRSRRIAHLECRWPSGRIGVAAAQELCELAEELRSDTETAVVLLSSAGADFCLGLDDEPAGVELDCIGAVARLPQPVIAAVGGNAWAEGCELALACDL